MAKRHIIVGAAVLLVPSMPVFADDGGCSTVMPTELMEWVAPMHEVGAGPYMIPVTIHIVRDDNGGGGATIADVAQALIDLNKPFLDTDFRFCLAGPIRYIDNSEMYSGLPSADDLEDEMVPRNVAGTANIYVFEDLNVPPSGTPMNCGVTTFENGMPVGIGIKLACFGQDANHSTVPHEMGHFLSLLHTHETAYGAQCPDGTNAAQVGDKVVDTPADPNLRIGIPPDIDYLVSDAPACEYTGDVVPPAGCASGQPPYDPSTRNMMSYSRPCCRDHFTAGQRARMLGSFEGLPYNLGSDCDFPVRNLVTGSGHATINGAIAAASSGDTVVVARGTYQESVDFQGKAIALLGVSGPAETIIDASDLGPAGCVPGDCSAVRIVDAPLAAHLEGFTITGGTGINVGDCPDECFTAGGGVFVEGTTLHVHNCRITGNTAVAAGGGIWASDSDLTLVNCTISGNSVTGGGEGGGVRHSGGLLEVRNCDIRENVVTLTPLLPSIARWDGVSWQPMGSGMNNTVRSLAMHSGSLIAGGDFTNAGGVSANRVARWSGAAWQPLGAGLDGRVHALLSSSGLVAGGEFSSHVAVWNGSGWAPVGSVGSARYALMIYFAELVAGGGFGPGGDVRSWDGFTWEPLDGGMNGNVEALAFYGDDDLIAGGHFSVAGGSSVNNLARWTGSGWESAGGGTNNPVLAMVVYEGLLIVGGTFTSAGAVQASCVAAWNGSSWGPLGSGLNAQVNVLAVDGFDLIAGGWFTHSGGVPVSRIARWDGASWHPLASGLNGHVEAIVADGPDIYAGGGFNRPGRVGTESGGGIHSTGTVTIVNSVIHGNSAAEDGGGILCEGPLTMVNCTVTGNSADHGEGVFTLGNMALTGCILRGNGKEQFNYGADPKTVTYTNIEYGFEGAGNIDMDAMFVDYDGGDLRLRPGSPCIEAADSTALAIDSAECSITRIDRDGRPRLAYDPCRPDTGVPGEGDVVADMGAYEFQGWSCDLAGDGSVGISDLLLLLANWGPCPEPPSPCPADIDGNGSVGVTDLLLLLSLWG